MKIDGKKVSTEKNYLDSVTYIPNHVEGNLWHKDCKRGVIISVDIFNVKVLYCDSRTVQATNPDMLVWG